MTTPNGLSVGAVGWLFVAVFLLASPGCATKPKTDWNQRVGNFTFDQAVQELGSPVASTLHPDGNKVAEWFLGPGPNISFGLGSGVYGEGGEVGVSQSVALPTPGHYLRLTFDLDGRLQRWEKFRR